MLQPAVIGTERYLKAEITKLQTQAERKKQEGHSLVEVWGLKGVAR